MKFCLPIIRNSKNEVVVMIRENINDFDLFEVWLDHIQDLDNQFITALISLLKERLIIVLRRNSLDTRIKTAFSEGPAARQPQKHPQGNPVFGAPRLASPIRFPASESFDTGSTAMNFKKRCGVIELLDRQPAMLDLDIVSQRKELLFALQNKITVSLIISYHNFRRTDSEQKLERIINSMEGFKPEIYKIAAFCQNENDVVRLLGLLLKLKNSGKKCIVLGIGRNGIITRIFGSLWGNELVYAPKVLAQQSAEGQLTKETLERLFNFLGGSP
jgi:3-dehydroquinate dehydratase type I